MKDHGSAAAAGLLDQAWPSAPTCLCIRFQRNGDRERELDRPAQRWKKAGYYRRLCALRANRQPSYSRGGIQSGWSRPSIATMSAAECFLRCSTEPPAMDPTGSGAPLPHHHRQVLRGGGHYFFDAQGASEKDLDMRSFGHFAAPIATRLVVPHWQWLAVRSKQAAIRI